MHIRIYGLIQFTLQSFHFQTKENVRQYYSYIIFSIVNSTEYKNIRLINCVNFKILKLKLISVKKDLFFVCGVSPVNKITPACKDFLEGNESVDIIRYLVDYVQELLRSKSIN